MALFLIALLLVYGGVHLYFFLKLKYLFGFGFPVNLIVALFLMFMVVSPILIRVLEQSGWDSWLRHLAFLSYSWMGFIFLSFCFLLVFDVFWVTVFLTGTVQKSEVSGVIRLIYAFAITAGAFICFYGYFEAKTIGVTTVKIKTPIIQSAADSIRIVQISDVHLGLIMREDRLLRILNKVEELAPDILVSTGDLVDGEMNDLHHLSSFLKDINAPYGKFAVTGNHEFYAGIHQATAFIEAAGFRLLRDEAALVKGSILIAGVDDPAEKGFGLNGNQSEMKNMKCFQGDYFRILLKHQPTIAQQNGETPFDLQLSGHTHKGQIAPFNLITALFYPYLAGRYDLGEGHILYVSRGSGTWGPPMRFLSPPEVVAIDLVPG
ncbi:MAG: metallophosphoesterase [Syntrophales bacterium]|jgi:predicted MPP superfamily phosphohydrolase|nr:metallophosphoesterase [Syntrophales bacterium]MDY0043501.1 metallophosphoesterase [Syntrophales bacterium]